MGVRVSWGVVAVAALAALAATAPGASAQLPPITLFPPAPPPPSSDTTAPADSTTTPPPAPGDPAPPAGDGEGGGAAATGGAAGRVIPSDALSVINSIARSAPSNNAALVQGVDGLIGAGVDPADATRAGYGRFPIAGYASWSDDWLMPRWTGLLFRYHEGCDVFAAHGTPVRSPVDGVARIGTSALGGLTVSVYEPDGTYYYLAHLSGLAEGLVDGQAVATGDVVGFVGTSGNAAGGPPHLHIGIYPQGGRAIAPKPILDQWLADAAAILAGMETVASVVPPTLVATNLVRALSANAPTGAAGTASPARPDLLWASAANSAGGGLQVAEAQVARLTESVDWERRSLAQQALDAAWAQAAADARTVLGPLIAPALAAASDALRQAALTAS